jgi:protein O-GlcNAc transferase
MNQPNPTSPAYPDLEFSGSRQFLDWLTAEKISLACTTYQTSRLILIGANPEGRFSGFERLFDRAMGLYATPERLYMSAKSQLWQLDNILSPGQLYNGYDKLYVPRIGHTTGDLDIHDVALNSAGEVIFISTLLNCLATLSERHSCAPLWKPKFISKIVTEDRCHLNGLAVVDGQPRFVTACSRSDIIDGWRSSRRDGGVVIDVPSGEIVCAGLSMPHSPRFYHNKLWLHNSGTGFFGYADLQTGKFEPVTFCPGYLRGLTFWKDYAIVGLSKPRGDKSFSGLALDEELIAKNAEPLCGLMAIELSTGNVAGWLRFEGIIKELYDVQVLPGVSRPMALGFQDDEIERRLTFDTSRLSRFPQPEAQSPLVETRFIASPKPEAQSPLVETRFIASPKPEAQQQNRLTPEEIESWYYRTLQVLREGKLDDAFQEYRQMAATCNYFAAYVQLGKICLMREELPEAIDYYRQTIEREPRHYQAWHNMGVSLQKQENITEAIACFRKAIELYPNYTEAHDSLGIALVYLDRLDEARIVLDRCLELNSQSTLAFSYLFRLRRLVADWRNHETNLEKLYSQTVEQLSQGKVTDVVPFDSLSFFGDASTQLAIACSHANAVSRRVEKQRKSLNFTHSRSREERLRIGYVSADFHNHATSHLMLGLFGLHAREEFEIFTYSLGKDDDSFYRKRILSDSEHFRDLAEEFAAECAKRIHADGIDILVDLKGYTRDSRFEIFALCPAPIQVSYLGYPGTMGADFIDYIISDATVTPPVSAEYFTEKLVILPHSYQVNDSQQPVDAAPATRAEWGLPEKGVVFASFNQTYKIDPQIFDIWMRVLQAVKGSALWLYADKEEAKQNLRREAAARGVAASRLIFAGFLPKSRHLARLKLADLALDTYYYNGHTTASDALWVGVPVLTCPRQTFASRVAASLLTAVGLPELIAGDLREYERLAVRLGKNAGELQQLKEKLAGNRLTYPLFDTRRFVGNLEKAYRAMWEIYAAGKQPQIIAVREE